MISPLPSDPARGLVETIDHALQTGPGSLMLWDAKARNWQEFPWSMVRESGLRIATRILDAELAAQQPIGIVGDTSAEVLAALFGCWAAGHPVAIMPLPIQGSYKQDPELALWAEATVRRLQGLNSGIILAHGQTLEPLRAVAPGTVLDLAQVTTWRTDPQALRPRLAGHDPAIFQGTAGSTGTPRTAILSGDAVLHHFWALYHRAHASLDDVLCSWLPLYHDMGLAMALCGLATGGHTWLAPTSAFAAMPLAWPSWLSASSATLAAAPNFAYQLIGRYARRVDHVDLGALRYLINGGEPIDCAAMTLFTDQLHRFGLAAEAVAPAYGLAEATCAVTAPAPGAGLRVDTVESVQDHDTALHHALLGPPLAGMEIRIAEPAVPVPELVGRAVGSVEVRGRAMFSGYVGESFGSRATDWTPTGDIGYLSGAELVVCGRAKEVLTIAGRNIFPQDIERVTAETPGVRTGGVVATMAAGTGIRPDRLLVVAEYRGKPAERLEDRIITAVTAECGVVPAKVLLVQPGELPRTSSGKLRRLQVAEQFSAGRSRH